MTNILVIEDDRIQADELRTRLEQNPGVRVHLISTELEFRKHIDDPETAGYALAVVDMMLRWTDPAKDMEMPDPETLKDGFYSAGLRCCRKLRDRGVKCVIFTALDPARIPLEPSEQFSIVNKSRGYTALLDAIKPLLGTPRP
jgi:DNA-binding NarL/FixJ family response regulator